MNKLQLTALQEYIKSLEDDAAYCANPPNYMTSSYYEHCNVKANLLTDIISSLKEIIKGDIN